MSESETALFVRPKDAKFDPSDLPVIQNLHALGYDAAQIGMILGYQGKNWKIAASKTLGPEAKEAIDNGLALADALLVQDLIKEATGYEWTEVKKEYKMVSDYDKEAGEVVTKRVQIGERETIRHQPGNARLAELLATNRLPTLFKKVSEIKKNSFEAKAELTENQVDRLIGRLLEAVKKTKTVESEIVENEI